MERNKENALSEYLEMVSNSWTWQRMTKAEQDKFLTAIYDSRTYNVIQGSYKQRWDVLNALYGIYLDGIGYDGFNWRDKPKEDLRTIRNQYLQKITEASPVVGHPHY